MGMLQRLLGKEPLPSETETKCSRCGTPAPEGSIECSACGWDLREIYQEPAAREG